eukprot:gb/GECG01000148.1/.p1 GENE.gb/GECG01000148.1/~~gb/GECG01000148.1/.p1  ORF type:complete len:318 (+),score=43.64 gb/GECG01000148.1/:1-954(+)
MGKGNRRPQTPTRQQRALKQKEPKVIEDPKRALFFRGHTTGEEVVTFMKDIYHLKKPNAKLFSKKNNILPFENESSVEFLCNKNDCGLFMTCSHTKKRPFNVIMGRLFNEHILDMVEFGLKAYSPLDEFTGLKAAIGAKPLFLFNGESWDTDLNLSNFKNFILDFFRGRQIDSVSLPAIDHVISVTHSEDSTIHFRIYNIHFKNSGTKIPKVELSAMGPFADLQLRRTHWASSDMAKAARKVPKQLRPAKQKNVSHDVFGEKIGKIHMERQNFDKLQTRKMKGLKRRREEGVEDNESGGDESDIGEVAQSSGGENSE